MAPPKRRRASVPPGVQRSKRRHAERHHDRGCGGKVRYRDRPEAVVALQTIRTNSARARQAVRVYECPGCAGWHLTSWEAHPKA